MQFSNRMKVNKKQSVSAIAVLCVIFFAEVTQCSAENDDDQMAFKPGSGGVDFDVKLGEAKAPRYLIYDVNHGEGFNLRRDVFMRIAVLVHELNKEAPWVLVLPAWGRLYHWQSRDLGAQTRVPWNTFFDLESLRRFIPVMEFEEYLKITPSKAIDEVYILENFKNWDKWEDKIENVECQKRNDMLPYNYISKLKAWYGWFFDFEGVHTPALRCLRVMGHASVMKPFLLEKTHARSVMIDRAEVLIHDRFGNDLFWKARRSMRFAKHLRDIGDEYRKKYLSSNDEKDKTVLDEDWTKMKRSYGDAKGGPYLAVHMRRGDFVQVRAKDIPSLKHAAKQIEEHLIKLKLKKVFIASDMPKSEYNDLKSYLEGYKVYRYRPSKEVKLQYKDGGVAIIDQWICAHARYFLGSRESTFSFRIQDEREILGFKPDTTFNRLCNEDDKKCEQPTRWKIVY